MLDQTERTGELFRRLSAPVAHALRSHLGAANAELVREGELQRHPELRRLMQTWQRLSRRELLEVARQRFSRARPDWTARLQAAASEDVLVRLYLESPACFQEAHRPLLEGAGALSVFQAEYLAYVVPSRARIERMAEALVQTQRALGLGAAATHAFVDEHQLSMRTVAGGRTQLAFSFFFESALLSVRAPSYFERARVRSAFAAIFADDDGYFSQLAGGAYPCSGQVGWASTA